MSDYERYRKANAFLNESLIRVEVPDTPPDPMQRLDQMRQVLDALGNPQQAYPAVHVAGTSGKGSTCTMIAEMLRASGIRTGLHVSPYVQVATEKLWVDGRYASADQFADLVDWVRPVALRAQSANTPIHGIASVAIALEHFRRENVEVVVMETGVGGRFDLTNVMQTAVAAITNVGPDHLKTLGPNLSQVAWHKAGIIKPGSRAVVCGKTPDNLAVQACRAQAFAVGAELQVVDVSKELGDLHLGMDGSWQAHNAALARTVCDLLDVHPTKPDAAAYRTGLANARLPARCETLPPDRCRMAHTHCPVILDSAHNPDKLSALASHLRRTSDKRIHLLFGCLASKPPGHAMKRLIDQVDTITLTEPCVYAKQAYDARALAADIASHGAQPMTVILNPEEALNETLRKSDRADIVVVTGSLYLAGAIRDFWYPETTVLSDRTSWPRSKSKVKLG